MNTVMKEGKASQLENYPCVGLYGENGKKIVVIFSSEGCGITLYSEIPGYPVGVYTTSWAMGSFKPFFGTITFN